MTEQGPPSSQDLESAFTLFTEASEQLTAAYRHLEDRVAVLNEELAAARSERLQQLAEKELVANRLQRLLEALPAGVLVLDGGGEVQEFNRGALDLLGEPLLGQSWQQLAARVVASRDGQELTLTDGRQVSLSWRALGSEPGQILLLQDVTETRALQALLDRHRRLSAMGEMAARLAHQIRTPLASATLYLSHLRQPAATEQRNRMADKVRDRLQHLERMVNDMLTFARGSAQGLTDIRVRALIEEICQSADPQLEARGGTLEVFNRVPEARVQGNWEDLSGCLLNLVSNALQSRSAGVHVRLAVHAAAPGQVAIQVQDNGPGIPAAVRERVFEPFFTTRSDGTGLGLAVVRAVVEHHGGELGMTTTEGEGTTFVIRLPAAGSVETLSSGAFGTEVATQPARRRANGE